MIRHKLDSFVSIDEKGSILAANQKGSYLYLNADKAEVSVTSEQGHMVTLGGGGVTAVHSGGSRDRDRRRQGEAHRDELGADRRPGGLDRRRLGRARRQRPGPGGARERAHGHVQRAHPPDGGRPVRPADPAADAGPAVFSLSVKVQP